MIVLEYEAKALLKQQGISVPKNTPIFAATEATDADAEDIKAKTQTLMEVSMKLGQAIYEAQQTEGGATDASAEDDNVVDADYEEVKDDDRKKSA